MTQHISICIQWSIFRIRFLKKILIYLTELGLSSSTLDLHCARQDFLLQHMDSLIVARGFSWPMACEILVLQPGIEPASCTARRTLNHLTTREGPSGLFMRTHVRKFYRVLDWASVFLRDALEHKECDGGWNLNSNFSSTSICLPSSSE